MPKKILLIDDEVSLCKFVKRNLERSGEYEVTVANSGTEGLEQARATTFDLVITDYNMPIINGKTVLKVLKTLKPNVPVVLFSVYHDDDDVLDRVTRSRADGIISKPIDHEQLKKVIQDALAKYSGQQSD